MPDVLFLLKATLSFLLDHLSLVASFSDSNRMTCQNLAVCFGPVLLTPSQECWQAGLTAPGSGPLTGVSRGRGFAHSEDIASAVDFKRHIEALHYLLKLWPGECLSFSRFTWHRPHCDIMHTVQ